MTTLRAAIPVSAVPPSGTKSVPARPGGGFLVTPVPLGGVFTREKLTEDQNLFVETAEEFWQTEVLKRLEAIEAKARIDAGGQQVPVGVWLLRKAGELGLLSLEIPEEYGGLGQNKTTSSRMAEAMGGCASQAATLGAHSGIGTLPILMFGNAEQKKKYLPRLATAELVSCYALTEPGSGSDALSGKTIARPTEDGEAFLLSGEKQYITNGAWADIAVVFAQVNGQYSSFIVDLHSPGVSRGAEEKKMGIRGSSTTSLCFQDVRVPKENMLGSPGDAAKIALNILYLGRMKLGFGALGSAKYTIDLTLKFGRDRKQFGQPVITFEMQKAKLADMVASVFAVDSLSYRTVGAIDDVIEKLDHGDPSYEEKAIDVLRSFGVETSIIKIAGSETLMKVANHAVRMHGGYGFCEEYQVERVMRDNVIDTIFEGTNDINRLVVTSSLVQNIFGGELPFREYMEALHRDLRSGRSQPPSTGRLASEADRIEAAKRALAYTVERCIIGVGKDVRVEQQIVAALADGLIALYAAESTLARVLDIIEGGDRECQTALEDLVALVTRERCEEIRRLAVECISHVVPEGNVSATLSTLRKLLEPLDIVVDVVKLKRNIAEYVIEIGRYPF